MPSAEFPEFDVEVPKIESHGDFSTSIAMIMASLLKVPPSKIAAAITKHLIDSKEMPANTEIAGPGFIN